MPSDLMTLSLTGRTTTPASIDAVELRCIQTSDRDALATAYLAAYPPGVAATSLSEAQQEMDDTFADEFGVLRHDLTRVATIEDRPVGAILVVDKSIWDPQLEGPSSSTFSSIPTREAWASPERCSIQRCTPARGPGMTHSRCASARALPQRLSRSTPEQGSSNTDSAVRWVLHPVGHLDCALRRGLGAGLPASGGGIRSCR